LHRPVDLLLVIRDLFRDFQPACSQSMPVRVDQLCPLVASRSGLAVNVSLVNFPSSRLIKGRLLRYGNRAEIHVSGDQNICWQRFVACKELAHLLLDREDHGHFTSDPELLVERLVGDKWHQSADMASERLAPYGAIEMLIPECCHTTLHAMKAAGKSHLEIATHFRVPERMIDRRLHPLYDQRLREAYQGL
jgi:hypothetical protein